jgi:hypothetical protein
MENILWGDLQKYHDSTLKDAHLKTLLADQNRNDAFVTRFQDIIFDYSHEKLDLPARNLLGKLVEDSHLRERIQAQFRGVHHFLV